MIVQTFKPFVGQHCETTTTGNLIHQLGFELSEPMLFGLGEGFGYIYWKMKSMGFPFIGGRVKPMVLSKNLAKNLNLQLDIKETTSIKKAWKNVVDSIDSGKVVGLQLDCYHLDYFSNKIHYAGHFAAMYGYDDQYSYLVDTRQQGGQVKTTLENLQKARTEKGPMSAKNLAYTISGAADGFDMNTAIRTAITNNSTGYLNPPIKNFGYQGIKKTATEIVKWFENSVDIEHEFSTTAMLMERAGTGGALFRNLYRDFLLECQDTLDCKPLFQAHRQFEEIAPLWTSVASLFDDAAKTRDIKYIDEASLILEDLSVREYQAMKDLQSISQS